MLPRRRSGATWSSTASCAARPCQRIFRSGFACFVGRPNAGKSTLTNALVGAEGRHHERPAADDAARGARHRAPARRAARPRRHPGLPQAAHAARRAAQRRRARRRSAEVDVIGFCVPADEKVGPGDRFIAERARRGRGTDPGRRRRHQDRPRRPQRPSPSSCVEVGRSSGEWAEVVPVSAVDGYQVDAARRPARRAAARGAARSTRRASSPTSRSSVMVAELIREAALEGVRDELPHSIAVVVEEMRPREGRRRPAARHPRRHVRRAGQPEGHRHRHRRARGCATSAPTPAGRSRRCSARQVFLDLRVKVAKDWQRDPKQLRRLGLLTPG